MPRFNRLLLLATTACLPDLLDPGDGARRLVVNLDTLRLAVGTHTVLTVTVTDSTGQPLPDAPVRFFTQDATIVTVSSAGNVTAHDPGRTHIVIVSGSATLPVPVQTGLVFGQLSAGRDHTCGVTPGRVYCWGSNARGQLGTGDRDDRLIPTRVPGAWTFVAAGEAHTCALDPGGQAFCWGRGTSGQLGTGGASDALTPVAVAGGHAFHQLTLGGRHTCGWTATATHCWGANEAGQLGDGTFTSRAVPQPIGGGVALRGISAGEAHTCGLEALGVAYCWGANDRGQLGVDTMVTLPQPTPRRTMDSLAFTTIAAGGTGFTCARATTAVYCWGRGSEGQLGMGSTTPERFTATLVTNASGDTLRFHAFKVGWAHACGTLASDTLACWGTSRLGLPGLYLALRPAPLFPSGGPLALGRTHSCQTRQGQTSCWGGGQAGALGFGDRSSSDVPRPVALQLPASGG